MSSPLQSDDSRSSSAIPSKTVYQALSSPSPRWGGVTEQPKHYPDCCLSLSTTFLETLTTLLHDGIRVGLVLSVGSGTGLLEGLLHTAWTDERHVTMIIEGVEVHSSSPVNRYLPEEAINYVNGTWDISTRAEQADALLFVYARQPPLVRNYIESASKTVVAIIWVGPKADWLDFEPHLTCNLNFGPVEMISNCGIMDYEMMVVLRRRGPTFEYHIP